MRSVFESLDIYQTKPIFFTKKGNSIPSKLGAALSIVTILSSLALVIYTLFNFFDNRKYYISYTQEFTKHYYLDLSKEKIFLSFFQNLTDEIPNIDRIIEFDASYRRGISSNPDDPPLIIKLELEKCSESRNALNETIYYPTGLPMNQFYCLSGLTDKIVIFGDSVDMYNLGFAYVRIDFLRCVNTTKNNNKCFSDEIIDSYIEGSSFVWGMDDHDIDHNLPGNPFSGKSFIQRFRVNSNMYKKITVKNKEITYKTDECLFTSNFKPFTYPSHDYISLETSNIRESMPNTFMGIYLQTSGKREIYTRKYEKIQEALMIVSMMLTWMKNLCGLVFSLVGDKIYFEHLINSLIFGVGKEGNYASSAPNQKEKEKRINYMEIRNQLFCSKSESRCFNVNNNDNVCGNIVNNNDNSGWNQLKSIFNINNSQIQSKYQEKIMASRLNDNGNNNDTNNVRKEDEESSCRNK